MKKILFVLLLLILLIVIVAGHNNDPGNIISKIFKEGSPNTGNLIYRVNFLGAIPVAEAVFKQEAVEEYKGSKVYHLEATAQSLKFVSKFFKARATVDSYVDIRTLSPLLFKQELRSPGKERASKEVLYDQQNNTMTLDGVGRVILPNTQDPLSLIFNIRRMDFEKVKEFEMNINTNQKNYIVKGTSEIKSIVINKKTYKLVLLKGDIRKRDKNPYHQTKISIVLLKEKENLPILIKVFAGGMLITVRLIDIK